MNKAFLLLLFFFYLYNSTNSQPGRPDFTFGNKGIVKADIGARFDYELMGRQMLLQADGSIYVILESAGQTFIVKKHANGSIDSAYGEKGSSGVVAITPICAAFQPDGKIVVAGHKWNVNTDEFDVVRYNTNGSP